MKYLKELVERENNNLFTRENMTCQFDYSKMTFANGFLQIVKSSNPGIIDAPWGFRF